MLASGPTSSGWSYFDVPCQNVADVQIKQCLMTPFIGFLICKILIGLVNILKIFIMTVEIYIKLQVLCSYPQWRN